LARYVAQLLKWHQEGRQQQGETIEGPRSSFIVQLAEFRHRAYEWSTGRASGSTQEQRDRSTREAYSYINRCSHPDWAWSLSTAVQNCGGGSEFNARLNQVMPRFFDVQHLAYYSRYEQARALRQLGRHEESARRFAEAYELAFDAGVLPPIDGDFRAATQSGGGDNEAKGWSDYLRETADHLIEKHHPVAVVYLALQCYQTGDSTLAEELLSAALSRAKEPQRFAVQVFAIEYLWQTGQLPRADALVAGMLESEELAKEPSLWRLASWIATQNGKLALALSRRERAMDIEYENLPELVNLQAVRSDYSQLLYDYQRLADAIATLESEPPEDFVQRVVGAADRWRSLDPDDTQATNTAANILTSLGRDELAWDYLTTPLADKPNEAAPWLNMAQNLRQRGDFDLAAKAFSLAYEAEQTNAQILWDHAQLLMQSGRQQEARKLLSQLASGEWQPRFQWIKQQAQRHLGGKP
jgi:hypothetical protein